MKYLFVLLAALSWGQETKPTETKPADAAAADPVVLTVGSEKITKSQFEQIIATVPPQQRAQMATPTGRKQLAENIADLLTLAREARARKLDQGFRVQIQIDQILAQGVYQQLGESTPLDDAALHAYYDQHKQEYEQVKAHHILIRFKGSQVPLKPNQKDLSDEEALAKAKEIREKVLAGGDFKKLAETESDDAGTAPHGGDLGAFGKGRMVPQFEQAAFAAEPGKITEPVKSPFGYHLIVVDSRGTKTFAEAKPEMEQKMKPEMAKKGLEDLKKKTTIVFDETYFGK
ncbi:MAG TPA: peptidylprolyl isomerase [Bryobacteraceae bacterium]|nr:peptidylprolyl isomerase [Bryobacteraceae bacterium]